jgi:hypothetical protein
MQTGTEVKHVEFPGGEDQRENCSPKGGENTQHLVLGGFEAGLNTRFT